MPVSALVAGKWRSPLPGPSWLRQRAGRARVGPEACRRASRALEDARMQGWRAWGSELARPASARLCVRFFVLRLLVRLRGRLPPSLLSQSGSPNSYQAIKHHTPDKGQACVRPFHSLPLLQQQIKSLF